MILNSYMRNKVKPRGRTKAVFYNKDLKNLKTQLSFTFVKNNLIMAHYNASYLSMLSDFYELKTKLGIIKKSFVTLGKPLRFEKKASYILVIPCF